MKTKSGAEKSATKQRGKPFPKGKSGNPNGKPKGCLNKATRAALVLLEGEAEALTRMAVELALTYGDVTALRLCLERLIPPAKDRPLAPGAINLPEFSSKNLVKSSSEVLKATTEGRITPTEAHAITELLERHFRMVELAEIDARLCALEQKK